MLGGNEASSVISWVFFRRKKFYLRRFRIVLGRFAYSGYRFGKRRFSGRGKLSRSERDARAQVASSKLALVTTSFVAIYARHYYIEYNKLVLPVRLTYHSSLFIDKFDEGESRATDALVRGRTEVYSLYSSRYALNTT